MVEERGLSEIGPRSDFGQSDGAESAPGEKRFGRVEQAIPGRGAYRSPRLTSRPRRARSVRNSDSWG
jgi:hypothetical protein